MTAWWWSAAKPDSQAGGVAGAPAVQEHGPASDAADAARDDASRSPAGNAARARPPASAGIERSYLPPPGDAAEVYAALEARARGGDIDAALSLYAKVNDCRLRASIAMRRAPDTDVQALIPPECRSLSAEHYREAGRWLERSADAGDAYAQLLYADSAESVLGPRGEWLRDPQALQRYTRKSLDYLNAQAARGGMEAMNRLAYVYASGKRVPQDLGKAYAYFYALQLAGDPNLSLGHMRQVEQRLSPQQRSLATQQGRRIYEQCCKR
ncbi:sel1 repeat family protein [Lysobacter silvisoli]|uniref:Sel1 repeat family protein n=1 Tax=Lysobacter silvisoli TaxID=2293254 RepID=A0A371K2R6_9GAMM|nr:sel1 repeat family protein [Lysobacter silvisoli]